MTNKTPVWLLVIAAALAPSRAASSPLIEEFARQGEEGIETAAEQAPLPERPELAPQPASPKAKRFTTIANFAPFLDKAQDCEGGFVRVGLGAPVTVILRYGPPPPAPHDPLVFDLHGDGVRTSREKVLFDVNGDGVLDDIHDISANDGILVFDADRDGRPGESGLELFGDNADLDGDGKSDGLADGFEALQALAQAAIRRGVLAADALSDNRLDARELSALQKAYGLAIMKGGFQGEPLTLDQTGIVSIELSERATERARNYDARGNDLSRRLGAMFVRKNGSKGVYSNLWLAAKAPAVSAVPDLPFQHTGAPALRR